MIVVQIYYLPSVKGFVEPRPWEAACVCVWRLPKASKPSSSRQEVEPQRWKWLLCCGIGQSQLSFSQHLDNGECHAKAKLI